MALQGSLAGCSLSHQSLIKVLNTLFHHSVTDAFKMREYNQAHLNRKNSGTETAIFLKNFIAFSLFR